MHKRNDGSSIDVRRLSALGGIDFVRARAIKTSMPRHVHASYCVSAIEAGARQSTIWNKQETIPEGAVIIINSGDAHSCASIGENGQSYSVFCLPFDWMMRMAGEITGKSQSPPHFPQAVLHDRALFDQLVTLSHVLDEPSSGLEIESRLIDLMAHLILHHSKASPIAPDLIDSLSAVNRAREWIDAYYDQDITTDALSQVACLSPFHLARRFTQTVGLPPHTYQNLVRLRHARRLLREGMAISDTAVQVGFFDQSHFTNVFKKYVGMTPGKFATHHD